MSKHRHAPAPDETTARRQSDALIVVVPKWALLRSLVTTALMTGVVVAVRRVMRPRPSVKR